MSKQVSPWPDEFSDLLDEPGRRLLEAPPALPQFEMDNRQTPYVALPGLMRPAAAEAGLERLESRWPIMQRHREENPLRPEDQARADLDYASCPYHSRLYHIYCPVSAEEGDADFSGFFLDSGLLRMCRSGSMRRFAEAISGYRLTQNQRSGVLVICFGAYDYLSAHNDVKWPQQAGWVSEAESVAYLDLHLSFCTSAVEQQYLLVQNGAFLNTMLGGKPANGGISLYRLPFWHQNTPLIPAPGRESEARRWLVMVNYEILGDNRPKLLC